MVVKAPPQVENGVEEGCELLTMKREITIHEFKGKNDCDWLRRSQAFLLLVQNEGPIDYGG